MTIYGYRSRVVAGHMSRIAGQGLSGVAFDRLLKKASKTGTHMLRLSCEIGLIDIQMVHRVLNTYRRRPKR